MKYTTAQRSAHLLIIKLKGTDMSWSSTDVMMEEYSSSYQTQKHYMLMTQSIIEGGRKGSPEIILNWQNF